jgi:hypothetical protein
VPNGGFDGGAAELILSLPGDLPRQVMDEFRRGWHAQAILAEKEQEAIAAAQPQKHWVDGIGQHTLSITPEVYYYWRQRLGKGCWANKEFRREFARDNPSARVHSIPRKTCVRVNGFSKDNFQPLNPNNSHHA